jgi:hypothetical protein
MREREGGSDRERFKKAHVTIRALREEQWRRDKVVDGGPVLRFVRSEQVEIVAVGDSDKNEEIVRKMMEAKVMTS